MPLRLAMRSLPGPTVTVTAVSENMIGVTPSGNSRPAKFGPGHWHGHCAQDPPSDGDSTVSQRAARRGGKPGDAWNQTVNSGPTHRQDRQ